MVREADGVRNPDDEQAFEQVHADAGLNSGIDRLAGGETSDEAPKDADGTPGDFSGSDGLGGPSPLGASDDADGSNGSNDAGGSDGPDGPDGLNGSDAADEADDLDGLDDADEADGSDDHDADDAGDGVPHDRPVVLPARYKRYSAPRHADATGTVHDLGSSLSDKKVLGMPIRQLAMVAAMAAAVSLVVSVAVSCAAMGMMEGSLDSQWRTYKDQMTQEIDEEMAQLSRMTDDYKQAAEEASSSQEASEAVEAAKESLRQAASDARAWLESGDGQWVSQQTKTTMQNALDVADRLVAESGITDPQTYTDAADALSGIIDGVAQGTLY